MQSAALLLCTGLVFPAWHTNSGLTAPACRSPALFRRRGIFAWVAHMNTGLLPFYPVLQPSLILKILRGRFDPVLGLSAELTSIINRCLSQARHLC